MSTWILILTMLGADGHSSIHHIELSSRDSCVRAGQAWATDLHKYSAPRPRHAFVCVEKPRQ